MVTISNGKTKYIHYGSSHFDISLYREIQNIESNIYIPKPNGGLWASPVNSTYGWKQWNESAMLVNCDDNNAFTFTIRKGKRILLIKSESDIDNIDQKYIIQYNDGTFMHPLILDFEKLKEDGISAIEVPYSGYTNRLLHTWDCDSILILDKTAIKPCK